MTNPMSLHLCGRGLDSKVKYSNPYKTIKFNQNINQSSISNNKNEISDFLNLNPEKEVKQLKKKDKKKILIKAGKLLAMASVSYLMLGTPVFAQAPTSTPIMPSDIAKIGMYLIAICAMASTILAIILGQLAGGYRMLGKKKEATEWIDNILRGYAQVILMPVVILTIAFVAYLLFGNFQWFAKPF